jgi:hypothetical protein
MWELLNRKLIPGFIVNPFYLYCAGFSISVIVYLLGWSKIFPGLSVSLMLFLLMTFIISIIAGIAFGKRRDLFITRSCSVSSINDIIFAVIIILGFINILYMGYLPIADRSHNYREFGMPVVDPLFHSLSIFFSVLIFHSFLGSRKIRYLLYFIIILVFQIILYRRSAIIWITVSSTFLYLLQKNRISVLIPAVIIICIPLLSFFFGLYGNTRSKLTKTFTLNELGASDLFKRMNISPYHYMTYLYVSSPLANLQENINKSDRNLTKTDFKDYFFYCLEPESLTKRLEKPLHISPPYCYLISPELIAGTVYMVSFSTLGWKGMIIMFLFMFTVISVCLFIIKKWNTFSLVTFSLLSTTISLLIFSNFLNRLDVLMMLFIYPVLFHFIFTREDKILLSLRRKTVSADAN